jgi:hemerythrin-like metal-binding protein
MSLFEWKNEYSVNSAELDSHHQLLFQILNSVYENIMNSTEVDSVLPKLDELLAYTSYHFCTEEQYMMAKNFQEIHEHIALHREFTETITNLRTQYNDNDLEVTKELIIVLGEWLLRHVLKEDIKYASLS